MTRRLLATLALLLGLAVSPAPAQAPPDAPAPDAAPLDTTGGGEAWYGYVAFAFLAAVTLFAVCKTSRRL